MLKNERVQIERYVSNSKRSFQSVHGDLFRDR